MLMPWRVVGLAQTCQPGFRGPRRGSRQALTKEVLLVGYVDPPLPCVPAKRATDSDLLDLPLTTSGAHSAGMLHYPEVCGEPGRRAALLSTTSAHLLRTASSRSRLHTTAQMRLRADEHLTARRALRPRLQGESANVVRDLAETAPSTVSAVVASSEDEV